MGRRLFDDSSDDAGDRKGKKNGSINGKGLKVGGGSKSPKNPWLVPAGKNKGAAKAGERALYLSPYRLLMFNHSPAKWQGAISNKRQTIGRANDAAIRFSDDFMGVDLHHASIWANDKGIWIKDLGSKGGTKVNGIPVVHDFGAQIVPGDMIQLGDAMLFLCDYNESTYQGPAAKLINQSKPKRAARKGAKIADPYQALKSLTKSQYLALLWISRGVVTDYEIARQTHRSPNTVRTHVTKLRGTLGVHSRLELQSYFNTLP